MASPPTATPTPGLTLEPGSVVAGYRIDSVLAEGETGVVYEATKLSVDEKAALRLVDARLSADAGFREQFQREARMQTTIDHPNVVTVLAVGESEHGLFAAMELVRGASLAELIAGNDLDVDRTVALFVQLGGALDAVHEAGLIHGNIRPESVLVRPDEPEHAFLTDFGVMEDRQRGGFAGAATADYMAPEQIRGEPSTASTDIYGLGAVLYRCLTGSVPFPRVSPGEIAQAHLSEPPPSATASRPELPDELDGVIATAMAKDPAERYGTGAELALAVQRALGAEEAEREPEPETEALAAAPPPATRATPDRRRAAFWAAAALVVLGVAAAGYLVGRGGSNGSSNAPSTVLADGVELRMPAAWHQLTEVPRLPGVTFPGAVALAAARERGKLIAAHTEAELPTLLPASFLARVPSESDLLDGREVVLLGKRQAFRYEDVSLRGEEDQVTVFVLPDRGRVAMLSCVIPVGANPRLLKQCEGVAASAALPGVRHGSLLVQADYVRAVDGAVSRLNGAREEGRKELSAADTAREQARAARRVGVAFGREAQRLATVEAGLLATPLNRRIVTQMRSVQAAYAGLANAALKDQEAAFDAAKHVVKVREAELRRLFLQLRSVGVSMQ